MFILDQLKICLHKGKRSDKFSRETLYYILEVSFVEKIGVNLEGILEKIDKKKFSSSIFVFNLPILYFRKFIK